MSVNMTALNQYKTVNLGAAVATASPHQLIAMLYDGALTSLAQAKGALERKDIQARTTELNRATSIILGLQDFLDYDKGAEIAENLGRLYDYIIRTIIDANREMDADKVQEAMDLLLEIKRGWTGMPIDVKMGKK